MTQVDLFTGAKTMQQWTDRWDAADVLEGHDLLRDKEALVGVPFLVTKVSYRDGTNPRTNYISLELTVAPHLIYNDRVTKRLFDPAGKAGPLAAMVINDGSTGICRQVTQYLHMKGLINVGEIGEDVGGPAGTSAFDRYRLDWAAGGELVSCDFPVSLACPRGLRSSEYTPDGMNSDAVTWYLA